MTYGWAILIIAIVVIALVSIGVFNGSPLGTSCIAVSGFSCQIGGYAASNELLQTISVPAGNMLVTVGQTSGGSWSTATIYFVNNSNEPLVIQSGIPAGLPSVTLSGSQLPVASGTSVTFVLPISSTIPPPKPNQAIAGYLWVSYTSTTSSGGTIQAQIATVNAKAT